MLERLRKLAEEGRFGKSIIEVNACVGVPLSRKSKLVIQLFIGVNRHAKSGGVERQTDVEIFGLKLHHSRRISFLQCFLFFRFACRAVKPGSGERRSKGRVGVATQTGKEGMKRDVFTDAKRSRRAAKESPLIARSEGKKSEIAASHGIDRFRIFSYSKSRAEGKSLSELCAKISDY